MKNKMLVMVAMAMLAGLSAQAVLQYEVVSSPSPGQAWLSSQQLTIRITEGGSLWMSTFVSDWGGNVGGTLADLGATADMTAGNYGWMTAGGAVVAASGETMTVTFTNGVQSNSTTAYHVGDFEAGDEIGLWLTNTNKNKADQEGYSLGPVGEGLNEALVSRQINTVDALGNTRINFGFAKGGSSVEFILVGGEGTVGQPLPGVFASLLLAGSVGTALTRRNRKRQ